MKPCASPLSSEMLVAYWAGDLEAAETDAVDDHLFACETCSAASARIASVTETLRSLEPFMLPPERLAELRAGGRAIDDNFVAPGSRTHVTFRKQDFIIHHLGGLELAEIDRVSVAVKVDETGHLIAEVHSAPFDAKEGEVLIACQRHFAAFPPNVRFEVTTHRGSEAKKTTSYVVEHAFVTA